LQACAAGYVGFAAGKEAKSALTDVYRRTAEKQKPPVPIVRTLTGTLCRKQPSCFRKVCDRRLRAAFASAPSASSVAGMET